VKNATTAVISSHPNFKYGKSPIFEEFFLLLFYSSHLILHSATNASATPSLFSFSKNYYSTNPHTSALVITSQIPSDPITIK